MKDDKLQELKAKFMEELKNRPKVEPSGLMSCLELSVVKVGNNFINQS